MKKKLTLILIVLFAGVIFRLNTGSYAHNEFGSIHFFIKHRPTWKWFFNSPIGMSDKKLTDLSEKEKTEEKYFNEFIVKQGLSR